MFGIQPQPEVKPFLAKEGESNASGQYVPSEGSGLATEMVLRGAVGALTGALAGAAVGNGKNQLLWTTSGLFLGVTLGQYGIVGIMVAAVYQKLQEKE